MMKTYKVTVKFLDATEWHERIFTSSKASAIRAARRLAMQARPYASVLSIDVVAE